MTSLDDDYNVRGRGPAPASFAADPLLLPPQPRGKYNNGRPSFAMSMIMDYSSGSTQHQKRGPVDSLRLQQRQINEVKQKFAKIMNDSKCRNKNPAAAWGTERGALVNLLGNHAPGFNNRSPGGVPRGHKK